MNKFILKALELSRESSEKDRFPAGALLVLNNQIVGTGISGIFPHIHIHAETRLIDEAMQKFNKQLNEFELYASMEPCLMCLSKAYWAGINKITYILSRTDVNPTLAYESRHSTNEITSKFNRPMELINDKTFYKEAIEIYKSWEGKIKK